MSTFVRAALWVLMIIAPGGIFLLPLLVGDAVARRRRQEAAPSSRRTPAVVPPAPQATQATTGVPSPPTRSAA